MPSRWQYRIALASALFLSAVGRAGADAPAPSAQGAPSTTDEVRPLFDGIAGRPVNLLGPFHADATPVKPAPAITPAPAAPTASDGVPPGGACTKDSQCAGRAYCDLGQCIVLQHRTSALIYYHQPGDRGYRFLVPIYWHWWSHDGNGRLVFPFYWHFHDYKSQDEDTVFLLYQHHRDADTNAHRIWPLIFYSQYGKDGRDGSGFGVLPLFWASRNKTKTIGAAPLLLTGWSSDSKTGDYRVFSLFSYFSRTDGKTFGTVFPLVWHTGDKTSSTSVILPLAVWGHDDHTGLSHKTFVPFFHYQSNQKTHTKLLLLPVGAYTQNSDTQTHQFVGLVPPIFHRRDPQRAVDMVFPLAVRWHDKLDRTTTTVVGPYVRYDDPNGTTQMLLPIAYRFNDRASQSSTSILFPVGAVHSSPRENGQLIGPFYRYSGPSGWSGGLFPLLFLQNVSGRSHQVLFPLFAHARDREAGTETTAVTLGFYRHLQNGWDAGLFPLLFAGRRDDVKYGAIVPLLYFFHGDAHGQTHVLGPLYASSTDRGYSGGFAPLIHFGATHYSDGQTHTSWVLPPLWIHNDDTRAHTAFSLIGPVFQQKSGRDTIAGVFPLLWDVDRGARHYFVAFPLAASIRDDDKHTHDLWIGPFVRLQDDAKKSTTSILFPLGVKHDAPDYHVFVQFPFFWRVQEHDETDTVLFPFYARTRRPGLAMDIAFPLVWRVRSDKSATTVVGIAFWRSTKERTDGAIVPIAGFGRRGSSSYLWALPLLLYHSSDEQAHTNRTLFTLFLWDRRADGYTSALPPLYVAWRRGPQSHFIGPFFYHGADTSDGSSFNLVGPFYYGSDSHGRTSGLIPFLFTRTHDDGRWSATFLPLFHIVHKGDGGSRVITLLFGWSTDPTGARGYVGPAYFRSDSAGYAAALIPIFFHSYDRLADASTTALIPLFFRSRTPERSITAVTPLGWNYSSVESSTTLVFPIFFDQHKYAESRSTGFLPLYIRHRNFVDNSTTQVFPLFYVRTGAGPTDVVLFPILWHLHGPEGARTTTLFPIFWDIRRGGSKTQVLFPLYVRANREDADHTLVLNFYYRRGKGPREGSYYANIFPFLSFGRPRLQDLEWDILGGLIGYARVGRNRTLKLLFGIEIALDPAPLSATTNGTLFTSNPAMRGSLF